MTQRRTIPPPLYTLRAGTFLTLPFSLAIAAPVSPPSIILEAERPLLQKGSVGADRKAAASGGEVLGSEFGSRAGHFAEYAFDLPAPIQRARIGIRYARALQGSGRFQVHLDGKPIGTLTYRSTGGWGENPNQFRTAGLTVSHLPAGSHRLRLTVAPSDPPLFQESSLNSSSKSSVSSVLDRVGNRADKNSVGHGKNVALYTGQPSRFFYATHELGDVFSAVDGGTIRWFPDHALVSPQQESVQPSNVNLDSISIAPAGEETDDAEEGRAAQLSPTLRETRQVCVTKEDVAVSRVTLENTGPQDVTHRIVVAGDCRKSFDWRGKPGREKATKRDGDRILLVDKNVFPEVLPEGLVMAVGSTLKPVEVDTSTPGAYRAVYEIKVPAGGRQTATFACAFAPKEQAAKANLRRVLRQKDPIAANRRDWSAFYNREVPRFESSDASLDELYAFRWFLLKFSTAGGDLGLFKYPVVMEGRQAFQTYCCYSAPFMAFDTNWHVDPEPGWGHLANMVHVAYPDGRFPWYTSPRTNDVPLDHRSKSGMSLMPHAAWKFYQIHGGRERLRALYPGMKKNMDWWIRDRDADGNGLFSIDHQLETGMDDLFRRWSTPSPERYEAVDATSYAVLNLRAVAAMAEELEEDADAKRFHAYAERASKALNGLSWSPQWERWRDRNPDTGEMADYNSITIFYPLFAGVAQEPHLGVARRYLLNPKEYRTEYPIPALSQTDPDFDPVRGYWRGPSWPAANTHVVEGFATTAKRYDRSLLHQAAELLKRTAGLHLQPRADFYERYNPFTGAPLSSFRDYMHSWWIDLILRHVAGLMPNDDGSITLDPLPMGLKHFSLRGAPYRGHRVDVLWNAPGLGKGLIVRVDGKEALKAADFQPGERALHLPASLFPPQK